MSGALFQMQDLRVVTAGPSNASIVLVDGVSLEVAASEVVGVVGETGAGKTLTMRAALGLLPSGTRASGHIELDGRVFPLERIREVRSLLGRATSVVLQNPVGAFDPLVRVGDQLIEGVLRLGLLSRPDALRRAAELLADMGFDDPAMVQRLYPHQLSGGMAQRVATAMGMMPRPRVLVLDEPTSALDANIRVEVLQLFRRTVRSEGTAAFLVSHDLGAVSHFCDRIAVMYAGRVVEYGETARVLSQPAHPYTRALLACSLALDSPSRQRLAIIPGVVPAPGKWPSGCPFRARCPLAQDICAEVRPALLGDDGRRVACHVATRVTTPS
jgi:oligopeptide/dipeptide ABC transporter ATP-binding protein